MFMCVGCGIYRGQSRPEGPALCQDCWERAEEERERLAQLAGRVPEGWWWVSSPRSASGVTGRSWRQGAM
jgi:hypothetical protein